MTELGNRLKEVRLEKDLSLDDLQSITKIQKRYLIGIEEGDYSSMPGNFYVRAFIKQYAEALELNPEEIFATYKSEIPAAYSDDLSEKLSRVKSRKNISEGSSQVLDVLPKILIAIFVIGAAGLLYYFLSHHSGTKPNETISRGNDPVKFIQSKNLENAKTNEQNNNNQKSTTANNVQTKQPDKPAQPPQPAAVQQKITVVGTSGINTTYSLQNAGKFVVKLVSKGQTWVNIKNIQGKSYFQGLLSANGTASQTVDLSSESGAVIVVGRAVDTDIYVNDQKLDYAIAPAKMVHQNITIQYVPKNK